MTTNSLTSTMAGSPAGEPAIGVCTKCGARRDRTNSRYCKAHRDAQAADYRARTRPRPTYEDRECALDGCEIIYSWCSMHAKQLYCSKSHWERAKQVAIKAQRVQVPEGSLTCSNCGKIKARSEFPPSKQNAKQRAWCSICYTRYEREWSKANKDRRTASTRRSRAARLLRRYQAHTDDIDVLVAEQHGLCYLCGGLPGVKGFSIDHDHELHEMGLKSYRGLACGNCNLCIGNANDDPDRMDRLSHNLRMVKAALRATVVG